MTKKGRRPSHGGFDYSTVRELANRFGCHESTLKRNAGKGGVPPLYETPGGLRGRNAEWDAYEASLKPNRASESA